MNSLKSIGPSFFLACLTIVAVLFCCNSQLIAQNEMTQNDAKPIRWELAMGDKFTVELTQKTGIDTNIQNRKQKIGNDMSMSMLWIVESKEGNSFKIKQIFDRIQLTITAPSQSAVKITTIDTSSDEKTTEFGERLLQQIRPLIGAEFIVTMTDRGEITDVEIPKDSMQALRNAPASMQLRQVISEAGIKEIIGQSAIVFPEEAIESGFTWKTTTQTKNNLADVTQNTLYTYNGQKDTAGTPMESFDVQTDILSSTPNKGVAIVDFEGTGKVLFATEGSMQSQVSSTMTTKRQYRDHEIKSTVSTDVIMKVTKVK